MNKFKAYYVFSSKEQAIETIDSLKYEIEEQEFKHFPLSSFIHLGFPTIQEAEIDEEGEIVTEEVLDETKYLVNTMWRGIEVNEDNGKGIHPTGFKEFSVTPTSPGFEMWGVEVLKYNMEL